MKLLSLHPNIRIRVIESFISSFASNMIFPFMAIYFTERFGVTTTGFLSTITVVSGLLAGLYGGYYADRIGRKKLMMLGESLRFVAFLVMMLANSPLLDARGLTPSIITFIMMILNTVCWGLSGPASEAMVIDVTLPEDRTYIYGLFYWINNLSIAIGGILGAFLFSTHRFTLFVFLTSVSLVSVLLVTFFIKESYFPARTHPETDSTLAVKPTRFSLQVLGDLFKNYQLVLRDRMFVYYLLGCVLSVAIEFQMSGYIGVRLAHEMPKQILNMGSHLSISFDGIRILGILRTENTLLVVLFATAVTLLMSRYSRRLALFGGLFLYTLGYSVIGFSNQPLLLVFAMLIATIGELMNTPIKQAMLGDLAPDHARSSYLAASGLIYQLANLMASLGISLGAIVPSYGMSFLYLCMGLTSMFLFRALLRKSASFSNGYLSNNF